MLHCRSNLVQFISLQPVRASVSNVYPSYDTFEHKLQFQRRSFYVHSLKFRIFCKESFYVLRSLTCKCVLTLLILFISTSAITLFNLVFCLVYRSPHSKLSITNKQTSPQNEQTTLSSVFDIYITRHVFIWQKVFGKCNYLLLNFCFKLNAENTHMYLVFLIGITSYIFVFSHTA